MKVALVYDRVNKWGGAERMLLSLHRLFPEAPLFTLVYDPEKASWADVFPEVIPSFLEKIPFFRRHHEFLGWLAPIAFESFDFSDYDLVISVTSEAAKGIITRPETKHLCYILTPTRYLWSGYGEYRKRPPKPLVYIPFYRWLSRPFLAYARRWDCCAAWRPDKILSISSLVKKRIKKYYGRESKVLYPPVETEKFKAEDFEAGKQLPILGLKSKDYYLVVSRLVPYKKVDLAVEAFNRLGEKLVIVGTGSEESALKRKSEKNIIFTGFVNDQQLFWLYREAKALIMPQEEDFGLVALEAQAAGCPVITYSHSGSKESVIEGKTGLYFRNQTVEDIVDAVKRFARMKFRHKDFEENLKRFSFSVFEKGLLAEIGELFNGH